MSIYNYEQAFGDWDKTGRTMRKSIERWFDMYYNNIPSDREDPCQRIPYTVVKKLVKAVFGEYKAYADTTFGEGLVKN